MKRGDLLEAVWLAMVFCEVQGEPDRLQSKPAPGHTQHRSSSREALTAQKESVVGEALQESSEAVSSPSRLPIARQAHQHWRQALLSSSTAISPLFSFQTLAEGRGDTEGSSFAPTKKEEDKTLTKQTKGCVGTPVKETIHNFRLEWCGWRH